MALLLSLLSCRCLGVTGVSFIYKLHYVDANNVWLFAPSHTALLGPLKDFWKHLLDPWSKPGEAVAQLLTKMSQAQTRTTAHIPACLSCSQVSLTTSLICADTRKGQGGRASGDQEEEIFSGVGVLDFLRCLLHVTSSHETKASQHVPRWG